MNREEFYPCYKTGKTSYPNKRTAQEQIAKFQWFNKVGRIGGRRMKRLSKNRMPVRSYECPFCESWHVTSETEKEYDEVRSIVEQNVQIIHVESFKKYLKEAA